MIEQEKKEQIIFALLYTFLKNSKQKKKNFKSISRAVSRTVSSFQYNYPVTIPQRG